MSQLGVLVLVCVMSYTSLARAHSRACHQVIFQERKELYPPLPADQLTHQAKHTLARVLVGEADWHRPDHVAISWVLAKRWKAYDSWNPGKRTFVRTMYLYAAPLKVKTARTKWVQSLPWTGPLPSALQPYKRHWRRVIRLVERWARGEIRDPCPRARHYGGLMDKPKPGMRPVFCGPTRNIFYTEGLTKRS